MSLTFTDVFWKNIAAKTRLVINQGGEGSSKTISIIQVLWFIAERNPGVMITCVSESMPHMKRGVLRDFRMIFEEAGLFDIKNFNQTDHIYKIGKSQIEFIAIDDYSKAKGPRRDYLYINEVNHIPFEIYGHLSRRTRIRTFVDFNPEGENFLHTEVMPGNKDLTFIHSTHLDNPYLPDGERQDIIDRAEKDPYFRQVYLLGEIGVLKGAIFTNWIQEPAPMNARLIGYGNDFGYVNDPTAVIKVSMLGNSIYLEEVIYERGLVNIPIKSFNGQQVANIHDRLLKAGVQLRHDLIVADSAEQKSISELYHMGWNIHAARKTSINAELDKMRRFKICIHPESVNLIKEFRNYKWEVDKNGISLNKPVDAFNHGIDAARYLINFYLSRSPGITIH